MALDYYFLVAMIARVYIWFRIYTNHSMWTNARAERICQMNNLECDTTFAVKATMNANPIQFMSIFSFTTIIFF